MIEIRRLALDGLLEIRPRRFADDRGFFSETWNAAAWHEAGIAIDFVQDNHSLSNARGTLRGLHFQAPPWAQAKLVRVTRGSAFDVAVDLRPGSPTYRQWVGVILSAAEWNQLLIPEGFAHGFLTLEENTEVQYKVTGGYYDTKAERGVMWNDPDLALPWPVDPSEVLVSDKDANLPRLAECDAWY